jgi:hypothetical protein
MAKSHKAQHWIPRSYLQAWTEPDVPANHEPFVHVFSKDGDRHRRRAPSNIFTETDLYTIKQPGGGRDLRLEHVFPNWRRRSRQSGRIFWRGAVSFRHLDAYALWPF